MQALGMCAVGKGREERALISPPRLCSAPTRRMDFVFERMTQRFISLDELKVGGRMGSGGRQAGSSLGVAG